ncbi:hypothetical protein [Roseibaca calidilacus]|uniref:hypothetical protein n=1 Tax=Roseibaca calidilacus TaxID=1666912 RepID=UPI001146263E|nr:hypothetical protein [Roseibaca calidilacus]
MTVDTAGGVNQSNLLPSFFQGCVTMEVLFAMLVAKLFGVAGLGGLLSGLFIRSLSLALCSGTIAGVLGQVILISLRTTGVSLTSWILGIFAGGLMAFIGWVLRGRKIAKG